VEIQQEEEVAPVGNIQSHNCSFVSDIGIKSIHCSSSTPIPYTCLPSGGKPGAKDKCKSFLPNASIPLKSEVDHADVSISMKSEEMLKLINL